MLTIHAKPDGAPLTIQADAAPDDPAALWIDLFKPTAHEEERVERALGIDVPLPHERIGEEDSARFYQEDGALFLTATLLGRREDGPFICDAVTFILIKGKLVTVREIRPRAFDVGVGRASARVGQADSGAAVLMALLGGTVERLADVIAESRKQARDLSVEIFTDDEVTPPLRETLRTLGRLGTTTALAQDSLASLQRLALYAAQVCEKHGIAPGDLDALQRDVTELGHNAAALETHLNLLQEATLGLVGATQSETLKALALATIAFVPPTLVASVFGMNFKHMDWFDAAWGPWAGFALMLAAPVALFFLARWRKWF
jgi:magnesium transporter